MNLCGNRTPQSNIANVYIVDPPVISKYTHGINFDNKIDLFQFSRSSVLSHSKAEDIFTESGENLSSQHN